MVVPIVFRRGTERVIATYDQVDIAAGTGVTTFFGGWTVDKTLLSNVQFYSADVLHEANAFAAGAYGTVFDHDYDVEFRLPRTIVGTAIINIPIGLHTTVDATIYIRATASASKWDGTTETPIISNVGTEHTITRPGVTNGRWVDAIDLVIPETNFKAGESLRISILIEAYGITHALAYAFYGHDPLDRSADEDDTTTFSTFPSTMTVDVPFKIDL